MVRIFTAQYHHKRDLKSTTLIKLHVSCEVQVFLLASCRPHRSKSAQSNATLARNIYFFNGTSISACWPEYCKLDQGDFHRQSLQLHCRVPSNALLLKDSQLENLQGSGSFMAKVVQQSKIDFENCMPCVSALHHSRTWRRTFAERLEHEAVFQSKLMSVSLKQMTRYC